RLHVVDADQRVIFACADEGDLRSVGRPDRTALAAPFLDERYSAGVDGGGDTAGDASMIDLTVAHEDDVLTIGRQLGARAALAEAGGWFFVGDGRQAPRAAAV